MDFQKTKVCDATYQAVIELDQSDNYALFKLANCFINGYDAEKLRSMLKSSNESHISDAVFILGEIGDLTKNFITELSIIAEGKDEDLASDARKLLKVYI